MRSLCFRSCAVIAWLLGWLVLAPSLLYADVRLPHVISSNMVLQRGVEIPVWGWADADEPITVELAGKSVQITADKSGKWLVKLPAMDAGGPHAMTVTGKNKLTIENILVGEVWVCSGQSNMEWPVQRANNAQEEIAAAQYPNIRLFHVPKVPLGVSQDDVESAWNACTPQSIINFSAVAYFFGRDLHKDLIVPVGLIETAWGGTRIEPWTPPEGFRAVSVPAVSSIATDVESSQSTYNKAAAAVVELYAKWLPLAQQAAAANQRVPAPPAWPVDPLANPGAPTSLYNGMVHGLVPFAIRGAIWYQGESNNGEGNLYHHKMNALIAGWRSKWGQGDFPFLYVQLAPFRYGDNPTFLPEIWEAQADTLKLPNTGMAFITDIGNATDIHPTNKQDVGKRLALWALAKTYGKNDLVYSGPLYKSMAVEGAKIRITFDHTGSGLASRDGKPLSWFTIAGEDGQFVEAQAEIDGATVVVSSEKVAAPKAVRFGWNQEAEPNLMNKEGLPASPFRTDR